MEKIKIEELAVFYDKIENNEIEPMNIMEGNKYGGMIYNFKQYLIVLFGRVFENYTDYCNIAVFDSYKDAFKFLESEAMYGTN